MWYFTELADKWHRQRELSEKALEEFVDNNPNLFGVITATAVHTSMVLGSGFVDLLRIGDGVTKEGGLKGWGKDGLRLVGIAGPTGKGLQLLKSAKHTRLASLIVDVGGPRCSWVASTKAMVQTGNKVNGKLFASIDDLAKAVGVPLRNTSGISLQAMTNYLRQLGANVGPLKTINSLNEAAKMLPRNGNVVLISVKCMKNGQQVGGHALYTFYDMWGRLRIMDRTGVYESLAEVAKKYPVDEFIPRKAALLTNLYAKFAGAEGAAVLAIEVLGVVTEDPDILVN
jgi:hypothetical protein